MFKNLQSDVSRSQLHTKSSYKKTYENQKKNQQQQNVGKKSTINLNQSSYGQKYRKKNNLLPQIPELQIIQTQNFIFQGRLSAIIQIGMNLNQFYSTQKHGEGILFLKNGTLVIGTWDHGLLNGRVLIFSPFGGKTTAQFYNGKLSGWAITVFAGKLVVCANYYQNHIDGEKIIYQANQQMWVISRYSKKTNSFQIIHLEKGKIDQLPDIQMLIRQNSSSFHNLGFLYKQFIKNQNTCLNQVQFNQIKKISISPQLNYIGYLSSQNQPSGLGAIFSSKQFFLGHFRQGSLQCYGRMIFQNGQIYHGQLLNGVFYGQGVYYNPSKNTSTILSTTRQEQKIMDQQQGYIEISIPLNYFKFSQNNSSGMVTNQCLNNFNQIIQKYYLRYYVEKYKPNNGQNQSVHSEFGVSQNNQDYQASKQKKSKQTPKLQSPTNMQINSKKWINFKGQKSQFNQTNQLNNNDDSFNQQSITYKNVNSLDKKQAKNIQKNLKQQQSYPVNFDIKMIQKFKRQGSLQQQIHKLSLNRKISLNENQYINRKNFLSNFQSLKVKQNLDPLQQQIYNRNIPLNSNGQLSSFIKLNKINQEQSLSKQKYKNNNHSNKNLSIKQKNNKSSFQKLNKINEQKYKNYEKNQRKYSHFIENSKELSHCQSSISNLSLKVQGLIKKSDTKRKKIFM